MKTRRILAFFIVACMMIGGLQIGDVNGYAAEKKERVITLSADKTILNVSKGETTTIIINDNVMGENVYYNYVVEKSSVLSVDSDGFITPLKTGSSKVYVEALETENYKSWSGSISIKVIKDQASEPENPIPEPGNPTPEPENPTPEPKPDEQENGSISYDDIQNHWAKENIEKVIKIGIFKGTSANSFSPNKNMTREQMFMVLSRIKGEGQDTMENAMNWAKNKGITDGSNPKGDVSREQFITLLWRAAGEEKSNYDLKVFSDYNIISNYAKEAFAWAVEKGLITGKTPTELCPKDYANRAQLATIIARFIEN